MALVSAMAVHNSEQMKPSYCASIDALSSSADSPPSEKTFNGRGSNAQQALLCRNFVADVVQQVSPSVVNIVCVGSGSGGIFAPQVTAATGSGFIITKSGFVVTNAHVVAAANAAGGVVVTLSNGRKLKGQVHSSDPTSDLALIKLETNGLELPIASLGTSGTARSGEFVVAIGSPMMLANSASLGIISATARHASELGMSNNRSEYIQTDAAINVGNSGGPLVNMDGEVIGINTMKVKGVDGISFAIPMDVASIIIRQLMTSGRVVRPFVGLKMAVVVGDEYGSHQRIGSGVSRGRRSTSQQQQRQQLEMLLNAKPTQVIVLDVVRGSPAQQAGLER